MIDTSRAQLFEFGEAPALMVFGQAAFDNLGFKPDQDNGRDRPHLFVRQETSCSR